ncbi:root phototropism protein 3-like [Pyrus ussuriensis x Pyrus communis]|uniref:Root phototropism protein 3-like n=1 Tax=Pyrus ussuriensis x Pyrus communis TaxID=2448454 RepID=A0A5N5FMH4_9ROSA|nr:root phototropism protein 3-like [Pyrus ussuriensis x Pyrus communis]
MPEHRMVITHYMGRSQEMEIEGTKLNGMDSPRDLLDKPSRSGGKHKNGATRVVSQTNWDKLAHVPHVDIRGCNSVLHYLNSKLVGAVGGLGNHSSYMSTRSVPQRGDEGFADKEDFMKGGRPELLLVQMQQNKAMEKQSKLADKNSDESEIMAVDFVGFYQFMKAQPSILEDECQKELVGMYAHHVSVGMRQTVKIVSLKLGFHVSICDKGGTTIQGIFNLKSSREVETTSVETNATAQLVDALQFLGGFYNDAIVVVGFEFNYLMGIRDNAANIALLYCDTHFLEMNDDFEQGNLISKTKTFLSFLIFSSWKDTIIP